MNTPTTSLDLTTFVYSPFRLGTPVPLFCEQTVEARIRKSYDYAFSDRQETHPGATPRLEFETINEVQPFKVLDVEFQPLRLSHGPHFDVLGFRIGNFAYCTDTNFIPGHLAGFTVGARNVCSRRFKVENHPHPLFCQGSM